MVKEFFALVILRSDLYFDTLWGFDWLGLEEVVYLQLLCPIGDF